MPARRSTLSAVLAAVALAAPAAQARPVEAPAASHAHVEAQMLAAHGQSAPKSSAPRPDALGAYALAGSAPVADRAAAPEAGFDWGSAAVGATAGAGALGVLALAGLSTGGRRRVRAMRG